MHDDATPTRDGVTQPADGDETVDSPPIELPPSKLKRSRPRSKLRSIVEWVVVVGGAFGLALLIQTFLFQPFRIPSGSMIPTLEVRDRIVVNKLSYKLHPVHRGDVDVFTTPTCDAPKEPDWADCAIFDQEKYKDLVKRVIALPGDRVAIADDHVYVNGEKLDEPYVRPGAPTVAQPYGCRFSGTPAKPYVIPDDMVFVMGDNRGNSLDGRCFGPIPESSLVGRAFVIIWPLNRIGWL